MLQNLLDSIEAPRGAEFLQEVLIEISGALVRLADESSLQELHLARGAAQKALPLILTNPSFSDNNLASLEDFQGSPVYKACARQIPSTNWAGQATKDALLCWALIKSTPRAWGAFLLSALKVPLILPQLPQPEKTCGRIKLVAQHFLNLPDPSADQRQAAVALTEIGSLLSTTLRDGAQPGPHPENILVISSFVQSKGMQRGEQTAKERLKKLTQRLVQRTGAAIRHTHTPRIRHVPLDHEIQASCQFLNNCKNPSVAELVLTHILFGQYARALLPSNVESARRFSIIRLENGPALKIEAPSLHEKTHLQSAPGHENLQQTLLLPLPKALAKIARRLGDEPASVHNTLLTQANSQLRDFGQTRGVPLGIKRLERLLPAYLEPGTIDKTLLHLMGLSTPTARDAGIYYFSPSIKLITDRFKTAVNTLANAMGRDDLLEDGWTTLNIEPRAFYGQSLRPSPEAIRHLLDRLRQQFQRNRGRPSLASRLSAFNARAAHLTLMFLASTGARPTENVFPTDRALDMPSGRALLSEKDSLLYRSTRLADLDGSVRSALQEFNVARQSIELQVGRKYDKRWHVFLLQPNAGPVPPTVANMKILVPDFAELWPWSSDALRHHFRSRLWELGCSSDCLAILMGHLSKSQTTDNRFATRTISDATREVKPYIPQLLDELGFSLP